MAIEILGAIIVIAAWVYEMERNLKKDHAGDGYYKFLIAYIIGFDILTFYSTQINNMFLAFLFALLALVSLLEFAFVMVKRH